MTAHRRPLRSAQWFGTADKNGFTYRSWMKNQGIPDHEFAGKPIIGICNTWSELTPCNAHFGKLVEHVRRGVIEAGGWPVEFPVFSNGESNLRPTAMFTRNLASMDVEEAIRGNPIDAVALLAGCDKTTPALPMGAASCDVPAILVSDGPMLNGKHQGKPIGSGTVVWQLHERVLAGAITMHDFLAAEAGMSRSAGTCNTMGTASTMACMAEALGVTLPHNAAIPAVDARRYVLAHLSGNRIVEMAWDDFKLSRLLTRQAFENAIRTNAAIGGSTNAVIHLDDYKARIGDPDLVVTAQSVLVMKLCGPMGYPGMAEVGNMGLPPKLLAQGVTDMVRISDARMSGTAYGTVVLHVAPEAHAGGPLAVVHSGDWIELDALAGRLQLCIPEAELAARLADWRAAHPVAPPTPDARGGGYRSLYVQHVLQADEGCDFDFLVGCRGADVPRHSH